MRPFEVISADDHIFEPPIIADLIPGHMRDIAPKPVYSDQGDGWIIRPNDDPILIGGAARADKTPDEVWTTVVTFENIARGAFDPAARVKDLDRDGIGASVLYPQVMRHGLRRCVNAEVRAAVARAYNEWIATFDYFDRERFVGLAVLPQLDDGEEVIQIMREARANGLRGAWLTMASDGKPLHHPDFEQFWAVAAELELPISLHIDPHLTPFARAMAPEHRELLGSRDTYTTLAGVSLGEQLGHLILSGLLDRHPQLRIVLAESGVGWIPYVLDRMDDVWVHNKGAARSKNTRLPSETAKAQVYATFEQDKVGMLTRHIWGVDNVMWASDYPHMFSTFPESQAAIEQLFEGIPEDEKDKMVSSNVARLYQLA